jgi:hypothetical protein
MNETPLEDDTFILGMLRRDAASILNSFLLLRFFLVGCAGLTDSVSDLLGSIYVRYWSRVTTGDSSSGWLSPWKSENAVSMGHVLGRENVISFMQLI